MIKILYITLLMLGSASAEETQPNSFIFSKPSFSNQHIFIQSVQAKTTPNQIKLHSARWAVLDSKTLTPLWNADFKFKYSFELPQQTSCFLFDDGEHVVFYHEYLSVSKEFNERMKFKKFPDRKFIFFYKRGKEVASYSASELKLDAEKLEACGYPYTWFVRYQLDYTDRWSWLGDNHFWKSLEEKELDPLKHSSFDGKSLKLLFEDGSRVTFAPNGKVVSSNKVKIKDLLDE